MYSALAMHLKCIHISRMHRFLVVIIHSEDVTENLPALHHTIYMSHAVYISKYIHNDRKSDVNTGNKYTGSVISTH